MTHLFRTLTDDGAAHARSYLHGLMQASPGSKNIERTKEAVVGTDDEGLQHFIAASPWDALPVMDHVAREASLLLDGPMALAYIDETSFSQKDSRSVGVAPQHNGRLGKVDNCQVAVFAALGRGDRALLAGARLYLPQEWCADPGRCATAGIPAASQEYKTKGTLALELILHLRGIGTRFEASVLVAGYGRDPALLRALDREGEVFVAEIHPSQQIWTEHPWPGPPIHSQPGRGLSTTAQKAAQPSESVADWLARQPAGAWTGTVLRGGTRGEVRVEYIHQRVYLWDGEENEAQHWHLMAKRAIDKNGQPGEASWTLSNAPADTPPERLVRMSCGRYFIERCFEDTKTSLGLADCQTQGWLAWHHHISLFMLAMFIQLRERLMHAQDAPLPGSTDVLELLRHFLPAAINPREGRPDLTAPHFSTPLAEENCPPSVTQAHNPATALRQSAARQLSLNDLPAATATAGQLLALTFPATLSALPLRAHADILHSAGTDFMHARQWPTATLLFRRAIAHYPCPTFQNNLINTLAHSRAPALLTDYCDTPSPTPATRILIAAQPKTASTFLKNLLIAHTGWRDTYLCHHTEPHSQDLAFPTLLEFLTTPTVTHQHIRPTEPNIQLMQAFRITPILLTRPLYDVIVSLRDHLTAGAIRGTNIDVNAWMQSPPGRQIDHIIHHLIPWHLEFLAGWQRAARQQRLPILWLTYHQVTTDTAATLRQILAHHHLPADPGHLATAIQHTLATPQHNRYNRGQPGRGQPALTTAQKDLIRSMTTAYPTTDWSPYALD